jgi:hypothetical protein
MLTTCITTLRRHEAIDLAVLLLAAEARNNRVVTNYACAYLPPHDVFTPLAGQLAPQGSFIRRGSTRALVVNWFGPPQVATFRDFPESPSVTGRK